MTDLERLAEFRTRMESFRASREVEKQSHVAVMDLIAWYQQLSDRDRQLANQVVAEWVLSANETDRADARTMAAEFTITEARPNLLELEGQLAASRDVHAKYELAAVSRVLEALGNGEACFAPIASALAAWASRTGAHVTTRYREENVRSIPLVDGRGREFQLWIERQGDHFVVKASNNRREAARSWSSELVGAEEVAGALDRAMVQVQTWMAES